MRLGAKLVMVLVIPALVLGLLFYPIVDNVMADYQHAAGWTKYNGNLDLDGEYLVSDAWVINDDGTYRMWYTRLRLDETYADVADRITALNGPAIADAFLNMNLGTLLTELAALGTSNAVELWALLDSATIVIGYATSTDGINWTIENNQILTGGDRLHNGVGAPCVIKDGSTYKMWYTRFEVDWNQTELANILDDLDGSLSEQRTAIETFLSQTRSVIGYATSEDLVTWTVQNSQVFPTVDGTLFNSVGAPSVIKEDTADYKMWYTGVKTDLNLSDLSSVLTDTGNFDLDAIIGLLDGLSSAVGYATSADGIAWTDADKNVLAVSGPVWESVGDPCVIKTNGTYEMWYTRGTTDLTATGMSNLLNAIIALDLSGLWTILDANGIPDFLTAYLAKDLTTINALISNTSSVIAYATSDDGADWTVQEESDLTGSSTNLWSSISSPCVLGDGTNYRMWFTEGIETLDFQSLFDLIFGADCTIAYAIYPQEPEESEANFAVNELLVTPPSPYTGDTVTISVLVINSGDGDGSHEVVLYINGNRIESRTVTLTANSETTEIFTYIPDTAGIHTVEIENLDAIFAVLRGPKEQPEATDLNWWLIGGIIGGCAVITAITTIFLLRRRFVR